MTTAFTATPGVDVISTNVDIPTLGVLAVNAFVLHGAEPVLVDTGTGAEAAEFMKEASPSVIDPAELRWIWLTHTDFDHIGSLHTLLEMNPDLRVITSFAGVGIMGVSPAPLPMDRVYLINPGQSVAVGYRQLTAVKPPIFDNPITTGFVDDRTGILFSSDCFGGLLTDVPQDAADLDTEALRAGQVRGRRSTRRGSTGSTVSLRTFARRRPGPRTEDGVQQPPPPGARQPCSTSAWSRWRWRRTPSPSWAPIKPSSTPCWPAWATPPPEEAADPVTPWAAEGWSSRAITPSAARRRDPRPLGCWRLVGAAPRGCRSGRG